MTKTRTLLRTVRKAQGLTQEGVANLVGIERVSYLHIEGGRANPSLGLALRIASVLGRPVEVLFADLLADKPQAAAAGD